MQSINLISTPTSNAARLLDVARITGWRQQVSCHTPSCWAGKAADGDSHSRLACGKQVLWSGDESQCQLDSSSPRNHHEVTAHRTRPGRHRDGGPGRASPSTGVKYTRSPEPHVAQHARLPEQRERHRRHEAQGHRAEGAAGRGPEQAGRTEEAEGRVGKVKDGFWDKS